MKNSTFLIVCLLASWAAGCENSSDNNRSAEFEHLSVNFEAMLPETLRAEEMQVGIFSACTRNEAQNTPMSVNANAKYRVAADGTSALLRRDSDDDAVVATASDHNFRFFAYLPWSASAADATRLEAAVPAVQHYAEADRYALYVASKHVTTVVPTVELDFRNLFVSLELYLPDDLLDDEGNSVVRKLSLRPAAAENFSGFLAVGGTYDLTTGVFTEDPVQCAQRIDVDFGAAGLVLSQAYTRVPVTIAPLMVPEGGFEVIVTDMQNRESSLKILAGEADAGTELAAGAVSTHYLSAGDDGIVPVTFPVVFPHNYVPSSAEQALWVNEGRWLCSAQTQAYAQWHHVSEEPDPTRSQYLEWTTAAKSPGMKGVWTGDYLEFVLPVRKFKAGTSITLKYSMYTRQGPIFWNIEYQDGFDDEGNAVWKCEKSTKVSYDGAFTCECTVALRHGNTDAANKGDVIEHTMLFEQAIKSGEVKIRMTCADGSVQANSVSACMKRVSPWWSGIDTGSGTGVYNAPFYFGGLKSDVTEVTFSIN